MFVNACPLYTCPLYTCPLYTCPLYPCFIIYMSTICELLLYKSGFISSPSGYYHNWWRLLSVYDHSPHVATQTMSSSPISSHKMTHADITIILSWRWLLSSTFDSRPGHNAAIMPPWLAQLLARTSWLIASRTPAPLSVLCDRPPRLSQSEWLGRIVSYSGPLRRPVKRHGA